MISHRAHDYRFLVERWRAVARKAGLPLKRLVQADGYSLFSLTTPALTNRGGIYISAGIHGDEPAATEGLITWAEAQGRRLAKLPLLVLPCLNPWGLSRNLRTNAAGLDLNREFHDQSHPVIQAVHTLVAGRQFSVGLMLHEDYDGQGVYLYEVERARPHWGEALLKSACRQIPIDPRTKIDGRRLKGGLYRRRVNRGHFAKMGFPEAIWLHLEHSERTFTFETPSEFALEQRVAAHVAVLEEVVRRTVG